MNPKITNFWKLRGMLPFRRQCSGQNLSHLIKTIQRNEEALNHTLWYQYLLPKNKLIIISSSQIFHISEKSWRSRWQNIMKDNVIFQTQSQGSRNYTTATNKKWKNQIENSGRNKIPASNHRNNAVQKVSWS